MKNRRLKLRAKLDRDFLSIFLEKKGVIIGKIKTVNDKTLSVKLLPLLDKFLKKSKVVIGEISDTELKSELPDSFTSNRIVKVILDAIEWNNTQNPVKLPTAITGQARNTRKT